MAAQARALIREDVRAQVMLRGDPALTDKTFAFAAVLRNAHRVVADFDQPHTVDRALAGVAAAFLSMNVCVALTDPALWSVWRV